MPNPTHMNHHEQSEQLKALLANQKVTPRWIVLLRRLWWRLSGKWTALLVIGLLSVGSAHAAVPSDRLIDALVQVESCGNDQAIGNKGEIGRLQICLVVIFDVNHITASNYTHADAFDPAKARAICKAYLDYYCTASRLGRTPTDEDFARCWNGGPMGYKKKSTKSYWLKVRKLLN